MMINMRTIAGAMVRRFLICVLVICGVASGVLAQSTADLSSATENVTEADAFHLCPEPTRWGTSADYLRDTARCAYSESSDPTDLKRVSLVEDIYIKSWSFSILNKAAFWLSILLGIVVLIWPSLVAIYAPTQPPEDAPPETPKPKPTFFQKAVAASSVQTSVTALAALAFAFYAHYKGNQMEAENLMREVIYAQTLDEDLISRALAAIREMDAGFGFDAFEPFSAD